MSTEEERLAELERVHDLNHADRLRVLGMWKRSFWRWVPGVSDLIDLVQAQEDLLEARWAMIQKLRRRG